MKDSSTQCPPDKGEGGNFSLINMTPHTHTQRETNKKKKPRMLPVLEPAQDQKKAGLNPLVPFPKPPARRKA